MSEQEQATTNLYTANDPCSVTYECPDTTRRKSVRSTKSSTPKGGRAKLHKVKVAFIRSIKRLFGVKPKKSPDFVMPYESNKRLNRTSMRSRSPTRMSNSSHPIPIPPMQLTVPSVRKRSHYRVHSYDGVMSRPMTARNTVRFSHPAVSGAILPAAQSTPALLSVSESADEDEKRSHRTSAATEDSAQTSSLEDSGPQPVQPKNIWHWSSQSVTADGTRETFGEFKQRLDGHKLRGDRQSTGDRPPSLQFIPRVASIKLYGYETPEFKSSVKEAAEIEKHRSAALSNLEGSTPQRTQDRYVLAILPRKDLPITAIQVPADRYPSSLIPGVGQDCQTMRRPHTFAGPTPVEQIYQAYTPSSSPPVHTDFNRQSATDLSAKRKGKMPADFNEEHLGFMPKFDTSADPGFNARHSQHYKRVESCTFDDAVPTPTKPKTLSPPWSKSEPQLVTQNSFLLPPTPPSSSESLSEAPRKAIAKKVVARKPVLVHIPAANVTKSLPKNPKPKDAATSQPVTPIPMNANGYPTMIAHPSKRFSAKAIYQRRSIDPVEAKYMKDHPKKSKTPKVTSKSEVEPNKLKKKSLTGQEKLADVQELDSQLKKLMLV